MGFGGGGIGKAWLEEVVGLSLNDSFYPYPFLCLQVATKEALTSFISSNPWCYASPPPRHQGASENHEPR